MQLSETSSLPENCSKCLCQNVFNKDPVREKVLIWVRDHAEIHQRAAKSNEA